MHQKHKNAITQHKLNQLKTAQVWSPVMTSGLEMERVYSQRKR